MGFDLAAMGQRMQGAFKQGQDAAALLLQQQQAKQAQFNTSVQGDVYAQESRIRKAQAEGMEAQRSRMLQEIAESDLMAPLDRERVRAQIQSAKNQSELFTIQADVAKMQKDAAAREEKWKTSPAGGGQQSTTPAPQGSSYRSGASTETAPPPVATTAPPPVSPQMTNEQAGWEAGQKLLLAKSGAGVAQANVEKDSAEWALILGIPEQTARAAGQELNLKNLLAQEGVNNQQDLMAWMSKPSKQNPAQTNRQFIIEQKGQLGLKEMEAAYQTAETTSKYVGPEKEANLKLVYEHIDTLKKQGLLDDAQAAALKQKATEGTNNWGVEGIPPEARALKGVLEGQVSMYRKAISDGIPPKAPVNPADKPAYYEKLRLYEEATKGLAGKEAWLRMIPDYKYLTGIPGLFGKGPKLTNPDIPVKLEAAWNSAVAATGGDKVKARQMFVTDMAKEGMQTTPSKPVVPQGWPKSLPYHESVTVTGVAKVDEPAAERFSRVFGRTPERTNEWNAARAALKGNWTPLIKLYNRIHGEYVKNQATLTQRRESQLRSRSGATTPAYDKTLNPLGLPYAR